MVAVTDGKNDYPTGYVETALPFHKLDDGAFEQFCTDLLNLHPVVVCLRQGEVSNRRIVAATRLLSGTAQKGADVRADAEQGEVWFFQCKRTKDFGPAKVSKAIEFAENGFPQADQFVLVTSCGLSEEAQSRLHERPKWRWWGASELTTEVLKLRPRENAINLVHRFFGPESAKALFLCGDQPLLKWDEFFARDLSSEHRHFHHHIPFVPWGDALARLEAFANSGPGRALILSAAGGQGKSRLLLELALRLDEQPRAPRVRFLNLDRHGLTGEQSSFLAREEGDLLLIVDDAHRLDAAIEDVALAAAKVKSIRLLVATRPQAFEAVRSQLFRHGYAEALEEPLRLPPWKSDEIHTLAKRVLDAAHQLQAPRLAALADRCPLLVVLGGALINSGGWPEAMTGEEAFRERVFRSFKEDFLTRQPENRRERLDRIIGVLSFVSPTPKNEALLTKVAEILGCSALDAADDMDALQAAGMLVENREGIRLYPDLFADAVLLDASLDRSGKASAFYHAILTKLPIDDFPAVMRNLAQADWESRVRKEAKSSLFDPVWKEFVRRFEQSIWPDDSPMWDTELLEPDTDGGRKPPGPDRAELLGHWASFAVFLPERTMELARLAITSEEASTSAQSSESDDGARARSPLRSALPPLLKPIVIWHHEYAYHALDILWSLAADEPHGNWENSSNAIAVIASAGSFEMHKPLKTSEMIMEWLEQKLDQPASVERLRRQPWILSGLLKPFFGREVEHNWSTGRTVHMSTLPVAVERTRPIRQRALLIARKFLESREVVLCNAVVPVIKEALHRRYRRFGSEPTRGDHEAWRPDRLEAIKIVERAAEMHQDSPLLLLQLRRTLWNRCEYDPDEVVREECRRVLSKMPDTFELRVMRVMSSWAHDEVRVKSDKDFESDLRSAEGQWGEFCKSVALEAIERYKTPSELCEYVRGQVRELASAKLSSPGGALLDSVAELSPNWCAGLLEELLAAKDTTLDSFFWSVIHRAAITAPETYRKAVESVPKRGRAEQLHSLINYFGWKQLHGGGLAEFERKGVVQAAKRTEESVINALASVVGLQFGNEPRWAIEVLCQLKANGDHDGGAILEALSRLAERHAETLKAAEVAQVLVNVGSFCFPDSIRDERNLDKVAKAFPRQVYEHVRSLHERAEANPAARHRRGLAETLALGSINDPEYVDREISALWKKVILTEKGSFSQSFRLALIRSLLWADSATAPDRIRKLIAECKNGGELKLAADLVAVQGSAFVFQFPNIVRSLLASSQEFAVAEAVRETLWLSACGGGRSFTNSELDPQYRYILEQGEALANRYRDDLVLAKFYRMIADSERHELERHKRMFREEDELE